MNIKILKLIPVFLIFLAGQSVQAATYDFYVDADSQESTEDGNSSNPFKKIESALEHIEDHNLKSKKIFVSNGTYRENISLRNNVKIYGEDRDKTIIDGGNESVAVYFKSTSSLIKNLTIRGASNGVVVDRKSKATIEKCDIEDAKKKGIEVDKSSNRKTYKFSLLNCSVKNNDKYGLYILKRSIELNNNYIHHNGQEGIDTHDGVKGKISNNRVQSNGESGMEIIVAGTDLNITRNKVTNNKAQGIAIQVYTDRSGKITLNRNTVTDNKKYGIKFVRFAKSMREGFKNFINKTVFMMSNNVSNNKDGNLNYDLG